MEARHLGSKERRIDLVEDDADLARRATHLDELACEHEPRPLAPTGYGSGHGIPAMVRSPFPPTTRTSRTQPDPSIAFAYPLSAGEVEILRR